MAEFAWDIVHYETLADYLRALLPFHKPAWISGITIHHTYRPTIADWQGLHTMQFLGRFYEHKGWSAGPHLFLAAGSTHPFANGIWAGTPLAVPGVHAGACNSSHIGIEIVGDYDVAPWPKPVADLVYSVVVSLARWGKIPANHVHGHRECHSQKTCPGKAIDMNRVRTEVARRLAL